jgi:hypothetical protein
MPGVLPNKAMHLTVLRTAGDRHDVMDLPRFSGHLV